MHNTMLVIICALALTTVWVSANKLEDCWAPRPAIHSVGI